MEQSGASHPTRKWTWPRCLKPLLSRLIVCFCVCVLSCCSQITSINTSTAQCRPLYTSMCKHQFTEGAHRNGLKQMKPAVCAHRCTPFRAGTPTKKQHTPQACQSISAAAAGVTRWKTKAPPLLWLVATGTELGQTNGCCVWDDKLDTQKLPTQAPAHSW